MYVYIYIYIYTRLLQCLLQNKVYNNWVTIKHIPYHSLTFCGINVNNGVVYIFEVIKQYMVI